MSTNLYDLLDVEESASAEEIRAAWKAAIADLDPTERRFRAYSDAAGVLLDPDRRAAYDAELAAERAAAEAADAETARREPAGGDDSDDSDDTGDRAGSAEGAGDTAVTPPGGRGAPSATAIAVAAVAAALCLAAALTLALLPGARGGESARDLAERNERVDAAAISAEGAAERMVGPVLSYNHTTMAADLERLRGYMTDDMATKQAAGWPELTKEAEAQQIVVEARATGTALTRVDPGGRRATVVVFIDQSVTKADAEPFVLKMWATFSLVRAAGSEATWLLDDLCTDDSCQ